MRSCGRGLYDEISALIQRGWSSVAPTPPAPQPRIQQEDSSLQTRKKALPTTKQDKGSIHRVSPLLSQKETENQEPGKNSENV